MLIETPQIVPASDDKWYKVYLDTYYHTHTPDKVIEEIDKARRKGYRIRLYLGKTNPQEPDEGLDWMESCDVEGYVGRSIGPIKIPLLIPNSRSTGGPGILDHCIVRIRKTGKNGVVLYEHPKYHRPDLKIQPISIFEEKTKELRDKGYRYKVLPTMAAFKTQLAAERYIQKLS